MMTMAWMTITIELTSPEGEHQLCSRAEPSLARLAFDGDTGKENHGPLAQKKQLQCVVGSRGGGHQEKDIRVQETTQHLQLFCQESSSSPLGLEGDSGALPPGWTESCATASQCQLRSKVIYLHLPRGHPRYK